jgi:hypothetical protein
MTGLDNILRPPQDGAAQCWMAPPQKKMSFYATKAAFAP